ncbi:LURP-one-related 15-like protein [Drosera capensis]
MSGLIPTQMQMTPGQVVVVGRQFTEAYPVTTVITKKAFSLGNGEFNVTDINGNLIFSVERYFFSTAARHVLNDASGIPLVTLRRKIFSAHRRWQVFKGDSTDSKDLIFNVVRFSRFQYKTNLNVFLASNTDENVPDFLVKGEHRDASCTVYLGNSSAVIAQMQKQRSLKNLLLHKDTYGVTVNPGVDGAFIAALIVVLREITNVHSSAAVA